MLYADGGGKAATAALNPIFGTDHLVPYLNGLMNKERIDEMRIVFDTVNGHPGALVFVRDHIAAVVNLPLDESNRVERIFLVANPDKLPNRAEPGQFRWTRWHGQA